LYSEAQEFVPTHTLWCRANDQPLVFDASEGFWRRIKLLPFTHHIPPKKRIADLKEQLAREFPGILAWAVRGCRAWYNDAHKSSTRANALGVPPRVAKATETYRKATDA